MNIDTINQSMRFLKDLELVDEDYMKIYNLFEKFFVDEKVKKIILENILIGEDFTNLNLEEIMKRLIENEKLPVLNILVQELIKNEDIVNDVQDIILEKLI